MNPNSNSHSCIPCSLLCLPLLVLASMAWPGGLGAQPQGQTPGPEARTSPNVEIHGRIVNGTTRGPGKVALLELIRPGKQMNILQTMENVTGTFRFPAVERASVPFLIRATYEGETYVTVVPPVPARQDAAQTVEVYDIGAKRADLNIMPGIEIMNMQEGLRVNYVYSVDNASRPPRAFAGNEFEIPVPEGIQIKGCQLAHESSRMPAPFGCKVQDGKIIIEKGFRPGSSQLTVQAEQESRTFADQETSYPFKVLVWKPEQSRPQISGDKDQQELNIRGLGPALKVDYDNRSVTYQMPDTGFHYDNPLESDYNPVFENGWLSLAGILGALAIIVLAISILSSVRIQFKR